MRSKLRRGYVAIAIMACVLALLSLTMFSPVVSTTVDFAIFNTGWNGTSKLAVTVYEAGKFSPTFRVESTGTDMEIVQVGLSELDLDPIGSALAIIGPSVPFTAAEGEIVSDFVAQGGVLLLADDFGTGNSLLAGMGATSRFSGSLVMDLAFDKKPEFCVCFDIRSDPLTKNVTSVLLNYPSSITVNSSTTQVVAWSSVASWLDLNDNLTQEWSEPKGPFAILAKERLGEGTIVLLSDPSVLINGMGEHLDNAVLKENLVSVICSGRTALYFDESHRDYFDPVAVTMEFTGSVSHNAKAAILAIAMVLALWLTTDYVERAVVLVTDRSLRAYRRLVGLILPRRGQVPQEKPLTMEELETQLLKTHPDWRPGLIRYVVKERERHSSALREREEHATELKSE